MDNPEKMCNNYNAHWLYLMVVDMKNTKCATGRTRTDYTLRALDFIPGLYCVSSKPKTSPKRCKRNNFRKFFARFVLKLLNV